MKAIAGAFRNRRHAGGYSTLGVALVLFGLVTAGVVLAPNLILKITTKNRDVETQRLARIREGLIASIEQTQVVPGAAGWVTATHTALGMDQTEVAQVYPEFPNDGSTRRILLIDPGLGLSTLPYTQTVSTALFTVTNLVGTITNLLGVITSGPSGVTSLLGTITNLVGGSSRLMLVSNTKRGLTLPVTNGIPTLANFNAIWNWTYNPVTQAPPSGWPSAWNGNGEHLHVERINLASLFHSVQLKGLGFTLNSSTLSSLLNLTELRVLRGGVLKLHTLDGTHRFSRVINKDIYLDLGSYSSLLPYLYYKFQQTSGSVVTNQGTLGVLGNGRVANGAGLGVTGPRPPSFPNFDTNNYTGDFDGSNDRVYTTNAIMNNLRGFTLACWIYPDVNVANNRTGLIGQNDSVELGFITTTTIQIWSSSGGSLTLTYPYPIQQWHHIAATGDGSSIRLYYDGALAGTSSYTTANYGSSTYSFSVGGDGVFDAPGSSALFNGKIDEVVYYTNALTAAQISTLASGVLP